MPVTTGNGGSATMRNVPDGAAVADPANGVSVYSALNGGWISIGGTSVSAPIWAGFESLINTARKGAGLPALGFLNPTIYPLGQADFHDITVGSNGQNGRTPAGYLAGSGYDNTTGVGSVYGTGFLTDVLVNGNAHGHAPAAPGGVQAIPTARSATIGWRSALGASGYLIKVLPDSGLAQVAEQVTTSTTSTVCGLTPNSGYVACVYSLSTASGTLGSPAHFVTSATGSPKGRCGA